MLTLFRAMGLNIGTEVGKIDLGTGNGTLKEFNAPNKTEFDIGNVVTVAGTQYVRSNGGFTLDGNTVVLPVAPLFGDRVIIPSIIRLAIRAYDQLVVPGLTNPNIAESAFYIGDVEEITVQQYEKTFGQDGIMVGFDDTDTSYGASPLWLQLALSNPDGTPGTYLDPGESLAVPDIKGFSDLTVASTAGSTSLTVSDGTQFTNGVVIKLDADTPNEEEVQVTDIVGDVLTTTIQGKDHDVGIFAFECAFKLWMKLTLPEDVGGGQSINLYDLSANTLFDVLSRS